MRMESVSTTENNPTKCPHCGSHLYRRPQGELHGGTFVYDGERVAVRGFAPSGYADPIVLDDLTQYFNGRLYRIWPSQNYFTRGGGYLHIDVWEEVFGFRHQDVHIHHRDGNTAHNWVENLECMPSREHLRLTYKRRLEKGTQVTGFGELARERAAEWHKSSAGLLWHKRHAERSKNWEKWKREPRECLFCGKDFEALIRANGYQQKFCTTVCKAAYSNQKRTANRRAQRRLVPND